MAMFHALSKPLEVIREYMRDKEIQK
jgi:hypothetical protein